MEISYWAIGWMSAKDGPGNRVVVYMQGCPANCVWCHSPHSRYRISPLLFKKQFCHFCGKCEKVCPNHVHKVTGNAHFINRDNCIHCGKCVEACLYSNGDGADSALFFPTVTTEVSELFELLRPQLDLVRDSGGITLSGGEALWQKDAVVELLGLCREHQIHTCIETSMLLPESVYRETSNLVDCWLLGFREVYLHAHPDRDKTMKKCKDLVAVFRQKRGKRPRLIARLPIIKNHTDGKGQLGVLRDILLENGIMELHILPCNPHMNHYYELMGEEVGLDVTACIPDREDIKSVSEYFVRSGIRVTEIK